MRKKITFLTVFLCWGLLLCGRETEQLRNFLRHITARKNAPVRELLSPTENNHYFSGKYRIIFANERYYSFQAEELSQNGRIGTAEVTVGSISRATGRVLKIRNVIAPKDRDKVLQNIREQLAAHFKCSVSGLSRYLTKKPFLTENFYLDNVGIHFVFNASKIAPKKAGLLSLAVPFTLFTLPAGLK